jgi:hypothetical protein
VLFPLRLHVVTAVNRLDSDGNLCHFLSSALWHGIPVTFLGWEATPEEEEEAAQRSMKEPQAQEVRTPSGAERDNPTASGTEELPLFGGGVPGPYRNSNELKQIYTREFFVSGRRDETEQLQARGDGTRRRAQCILPFIALFVSLLPFLLHVFPVGFESDVAVALP